jgi:hypothetical protein
MNRAPHSMSGSSISTRSCAGNRVLLRIFTEIAKSSTFPLDFGVLHRYFWCIIYTTKN